jgi:O-antigen/teichoic acid export membrane protein
LATRVLSASDFGIYGMVMSVVFLAGALCNGGAGLLLPRHLATSTPDERRRLIASLAAFETVGGLVLAGILLIAWPSVRVPLGINGSLPIAIVAIAALLIPLRALTQVASVAFSVSGRGEALALQVLAQSLTGFVVESSRCSGSVRVCLRCLRVAWPGRSPRSRLAFR